MINQALRNLYLSNLPNLNDFYRAIEDTNSNDLGAPLLMQCLEDDYNQSHMRLLFVGQEATAWFTDIQAVTQEAVVSLLAHYEEFAFGAEWNSVFFQYIKEINSQVNSGKREFLWTNLLKFGRSKTHGRPEHKIVQLEVIHFNILMAEIRIVRPDAIIFLSGPDYDLDIAQRIPGVAFMPCGANAPRQLSRLCHPELPKHTYRTYHPNYLRQSRQEEKYRDEIVSMLKTT